MQGSSGWQNFYPAKIYSIEFTVFCLFVFFFHVAIDLQSCGVTTDGAKLFIEVLKLNSCLMVLDIRANALIGKRTCVKKKPYSGKLWQGFNLAICRKDND